MNHKLTFQDLAAQLAVASGQSQSFSEDFIKELFADVSEALSQGVSVKIKGLGEFKPSAESPDRVLFIPDESLAEKVNAPFNQFAPAKLNPEVTDDRLGAVEALDTTEKSIEDVTDDADSVSISEPINVTETEISSQSTDAEERIPMYIPSDEVAEYDDRKAEESIEILETPAASSPAIPEIIPIEEDEEEIFVGNDSKSHPLPPPFEAVRNIEDEPETHPQQETAESKSNGFGLGFLVGLIVGIAIGAAAMFFYATSLTPSRPEAAETEEEAGMAEEITDVTAMPDTAWVERDTVSTPAPAAVEPELVAQPESVTAVPASPVTDKVKAGYLMPKMAQKHYGNQVFWVYIYEENKNKISNPNNLTAGLELVIPAPEKYGIDANDPASIARAQEKETELWNKK